MNRHSETKKLTDEQALEETDKIFNIIEPVLSQKIKKKFGTFFPVQVATIPALILPQKQDVCVSAPTGQGKTLCFCVPAITNVVLKMRSTGKIRSLLMQTLIVVPTKELGFQIFQVLKSLLVEEEEEEEEEGGAEGGADYSFLKNIRTACTVGKQDIETENRIFDYSHLPNATSESHVLSREKKTSPHILVSTPGRLVEHYRIIAAQGREVEVFGDLETVVIDEADRLLTSMFDGWIETLWDIDRLKKQHSIPSDGLTNDNSATEEANFEMEVRNKQIVNSYVSKWVFSATLSPADPALAQLQLSKFPPPIWITSGNDQNASFILQPDSLRQFYCVVPESFHRLPALIYILYQLKANYAKVKGREHVPKIAVFSCSKKIASSVCEILNVHFNEDHSEYNPPASVLETTLMIEDSVDVSESEEKRDRVYLDDFDVRMNVSELSANLSVKKRAKIVKDFDAGVIDTLIASDVMARGVDISTIDLVINFDLPSTPAGYIHRSGRTARAGAWGSTLTIVDDQNLDVFKKMIKRCVPGGMKSLVTYPIPQLEIMSMKNN